MKNEVSRSEDAGCGFRNLSDDHNIRTVCFEHELMEPGLPGYNLICRNVNNVTKFMNII
jgi:hypothetical protein